MPRLKFTLLPAATAGTIGTPVLVDSLSEGLQTQSCHQLIVKFTHYIFILSADFLCKDRRAQRLNTGARIHSTPMSTCYLLTVDNK